MNRLFDQGLKIEIARNMRKHGGGFVVALSSLILHADYQNLEKIEKTFKKYIDEYMPGMWPPLY